MRSKSATYYSVTVGANILKVKDLEFSKELSFENFQVSDGQLGRWKNDLMSVLKLYQVTSIYKAETEKYL